MDRRSAIAAGISGAFVAIRSLTAKQSSDAPPLIPAPYLQPLFLAPPNAPGSIVIAKGEPGERLVVTGRVLDGTRAVAGASIYVVQADASGRYSKEDPDSDVTFDENGSVVAIKARLYGFMRSDANGQYRFETIRPGQYGPQTNPSHVHYVVRSTGYKSRMMDLRFEDDPVMAARRKEGIPDDDGFEPGRMVVRPITRDASGVWHVARDLDMIAE